MSARPDITLLVCTRDRAHALPSLLSSISRAAKAAPETCVEVLIVDNGSTDDTGDVLSRWQGAQPFTVTLLHEKRAGLAIARNTGLTRAKGTVVAMTDDDCVLHIDYFNALFRRFAHVGGPAIIGGRILPGNPEDLPVTLKLEDHPMIAARGSFPGGFVMGANLAMSADVIARIGLFDERFGAGAPFVAAEDTDFLFRAMGAGIPVMYDPSFAVDHHHGRRDTADETRLLAGYSFGDGALYAKHLFRDLRAIRAIARDILDLRLDLLKPVRTHRGIRWFYHFRLRHKVQGMIRYASIGGRHFTRIGNFP